MPRRKIAATAAAARRIEASNVASPYSQGLDRVPRVIDTVEAMFKRRQIDGQQRMAAETYRHAFEAVTAGALGNTMDFDRVRGGNPQGAPPCPAALRGADVLDRARHILGATDAAIVEAVCGLGHSVEEVASRFLRRQGGDALTALGAGLGTLRRRETGIRGFVADGEADDGAGGHAGKVRGARGPCHQVADPHLRVSRHKAGSLVRSIGLARRLRARNRPPRLSAVASEMDQEPPPALHRKFRISPRGNVISVPKTYSDVATKLQRW